MDKQRKVGVMIPLAAALGLGLAAALPAQQQQGLVNVNVSDNEILKELNLSAPITVQAPISVAANVCEVNANVLAEQVRNGAATCEARSNSSALTQLVNRQRVGG